jgi:MraZ protein
MFIGTYFNSIDAKNRLIVPSRHRDNLGGRCVLTRGLDTCLYVYTMDEWEKQTEKIAELPESDPKIRAFVRSFIGYATECDLDKQGRILIPAPLIEYAGIKKDLVTVGAIKKIEIWSKELWQSPDDEIKLSNKELSKALEKYNY